MHTRAYVYNKSGLVHCWSKLIHAHSLINSSSILNQTIFPFLFFFFFLPYSFRVVATSCIQPLKRSCISSVSSSPCLFWLLFFLSSEGSFFRLLSLSISHHACSRQLPWYGRFPFFGFYFRLFVCQDMISLSSA